LGSGFCGNIAAVKNSLYAIAKALKTAYIGGNNRV